MKLDDLKVYQKAMKLGDNCWNVVQKWSYFEKDTIGKQLVKSSDSVAANISEGFGRFHYRENKHFNYIARGSLFETKTWIDKASSRNLINNDTFCKIKKDINEIALMLNSYISKIGADVVNEIEIEYGKEFTNDPFSNNRTNNSQ